MLLFHYLSSLLYPCIIISASISSYLSSLLLLLLLSSLMTHDSPPNPIYLAPTPAPVLFTQNQYQTRTWIGRTKSRKSHCSHSQIRCTLSACCRGRMLSLCY
ncbi:hypothetical protein L226DRAFT_318585 [Lentinus tigrinus ALCF2SS1-7]|uniref:uncharacterized protein n=1 Tax=Lentinus tigrinus ALCF2SS1-7 TaxID=1328758 RepID=UPI0011660874|nr:hypothetical protein L226DRAFT_318585 [Lentinus tigrinus ALCF2SS1-7]